MLRQMNLYGDSIRLGYQPFLEQRCKNKFCISALEENCGDSSNLFSMLEKQNPKDLIIINAGLHDIRKDNVTGCNQVSLGKYESNLRKIFEQLKGRHIFWLTSVPFNEKKYNQVNKIAEKNYSRFISDLKKYNKKSIEICSELGVQYVDAELHFNNLDLGKYRVDDGLHLKPEGYKKLAEFICKEIAEA